MGTVYAIANQKGGVGKTTTSVNLAACTASEGEQTLIVDLDPQCNATVALGGDRELHPSSYDCLIGDTEVAAAARPAGPDNLWLVPANVDLAGAAIELPRIESSETRLRERLGPVRERFARTFLDCPPSLGPVSVNAMVAADRVIVPVQAEYLALEGLVQFLDTLGLIRRQLNPQLEVSGLLITMYDERTRLAQDVESELRPHFPEMVFDTVIPRSVRVAESPSYGLPVTEHAPSSRGAVAYRALAKELAALPALAASIEAAGVVQPLLVRPLADGSYELVAGERRWRAAQQAGLEKVPAVVRDQAEPERLQAALIENMVREDLNPVEEAKACAALVEDLGLTKEELARRVGRSRPAISNLIRLLELPDETLESLEKGDLSEGHGRALLGAPGNDVRRRLARDAVTGGWSVRETEQRVRLAGQPKARPRRAPAVTPDERAAMDDATDALETALGHEASVKPRRTGIVVELRFDNLDEAHHLARELRRRGK